MNRRYALALVSSFIASPAIARPGVTLSMRNVMGESLKLRYHGDLSSSEHAAFDHLARDRRQNISRKMDATLLDILQLIVEESGQGGSFTLLSGFRTRATNAILPGAAENSFHLGGRALDISREGMTVGEISASVAQHSGGLGLYGKNGFVHIDTGPFRRWGDANGRLPAFRQNGRSAGQRKPIQGLADITSDMLLDLSKF